MGEKQGLWPLDVSLVSEEEAKSMSWDIKQPDATTISQCVFIPLKFQMGHKDMILCDQSFGNQGQLTQKYRHPESQRICLNVSFSWKHGVASCELFEVVHTESPSSSSDTSSSDQDDNSASHSDDDCVKLPAEPLKKKKFTPPKHISTSKSGPKHLPTSKSVPVQSKSLKLKSKRKPDPDPESESESDEIAPKRKRKIPKKNQSQNSSLAHLKVSDNSLHFSSKRKNSSPVSATTTYTSGVVSELPDITSATESVLSWCSYLVPKQNRNKGAEAKNKPVFIAFYDDGQLHEDQMEEKLPDKKYWTGDKIINPKHFKVVGHPATIAQFQSHPRSKLIFNGSYLVEIREVFTLASNYIGFVPRVMLIVTLRNLEVGALLKGVQFGRPNEKILIVNPNFFSLKLYAEYMLKKSNDMETIECPAKNCVIVNSNCRISVCPDAKDKIGSLVFFVDAEIDQTAEIPKRAVQVSIFFLFFVIFLS